MPDPTPLSPSVIASRYRVLRELGRGGMGAVYLVEHAHTGDQLALKLLHARAGATPEVVARFKREARAPAQIKSENVVKVTDADVAPELGGAPFLVMELLEGCDLEKLVLEHGPQSPGDLVTWLSQVARALDKAHAIGIVHRDLKPENLFLHRREDGSTIVKILDFGISKAVGAEAGGSTAEGGGLTKSGSIFGTPLYMAPEQARGQHGMVGPPTDQWAMALIAYRLLTAQVYWSASTFAELVVQIIAEPMPPPSSRVPGLGPAFDAWFARSCEREPGSRWRTVGEQVAALAQALGVSASAPAPMSALAQPAAVPAVVDASTNAPTLDSSGIGTTASPLSHTTPRTDVSPKRRVPALVALGSVIVIGVAATLGAVVLRSGAQPAASGSAAESAAAEPAPAAPPSAAVLPTVEAPSAPLPVEPSASVGPSAKAAAAPRAGTERTLPKAAKPGAAEPPTPASKPGPSAADKPKPYAPVAP